MISEKVEVARIRKALRDSPTPILAPQECIKKALSERNVCLSWSGGKCSTAVLHMALEIDPEIQVMFNDTGVEFPETYAFIRNLHETWGFNLEIVKPETTFWTCVKKYGFPMLRGQYKDNSKSKDGKPMCCQLLKEKPLLKFLQENDFEGTITGIRASESRMRTFAIAQKGQYYYAKTLKQWRYHPIAFWSRNKLDDYHKEHNLPQNKVYGMGQERCGCWPCTGYITWQESLAQSHPKLYHFLARQTGQPTLWEYFDYRNCGAPKIEI